ncbi:anthranilate phosphoribosyltransferase family protein [Spirulina sp. CS-785/01]|uniref:anthranilate phosphoribosyltransferase family protein n=1 Tax=Spirulina sp. CS-785/01 TaxID=3021716 RepID=UPI00232FF210|nr:anthranilate phosphoribosyltransferase family protein [Spirulina sp. CS-785/01]MDB9314045.1 anthranilate phosphoribosyltransferase family protein [Spirulina sp. CS-785/01]
MSNTFRELLKKIGSGPHTGKNLSREEAAQATTMILQEEATPAQIGAFLIAHRIKRPTAEELAGMLDAYEALGCSLQPLPGEETVTVMGVPYDGRSRTAPVTALTGLILAAAGVPIVQHGGNCMPTKYGIPLIEVWQGLGVDFTSLSLSHVQHLLAKTGFGFIYTPRQFPLVETLVPYRDQVGKRPPFATVELIWSPYQGKTHLVAGFVHPPTEKFMQGTLALRGMETYTLVKGLEGSCDLSCDRTAIIATHNPTDSEFQRLKLHPRDYHLDRKDVPLTTQPEYLKQLQGVIAGESNDLQKTALWNGGFYLWRCGNLPNLEAGIAKVESLLTKGKVQQKLHQVQQFLASCP